MKTDNCSRQRPCKKASGYWERTGRRKREKWLRIREIPDARNFPGIGGLSFSCMTQVANQLDADCSTEWSEVPVKKVQFRLISDRQRKTRKKIGSSEFTNVEQNRIEEKRSRTKLDFVDGDMFVFEVTIPISLYPRKLADEVHLPLHLCTNAFAFQINVLIHLMKLISRC